MMTNLEPVFVPVLITGEKRSGTTFVANFLNTQPSCLVYADFLRSLFIEARRIPVEDVTAGLNVREKNILLSNLVAEGYRIGFSDFQGIKRTEFSSWLDLYLLGLKCLAQHQEYAVVGTKATCEYQQLPILLEAGVHVILCLRDPRDVLLSAKNRFSNYNMFEYIKNWRLGYVTACRFENHPNMFVLQFEHLIDEATRSETIGALSRFLGTSLNENVTALHILGGTNFQANTSFGDVVKAFDTNVLFRWKDNLETPEVQFTSKILKKEIEALQYQPLESTPSVFRALYRQYIRYAIKQRLKATLLSIYHQIFK